MHPRIRPAASVLAACSALALVTLSGCPAQQETATPEVAPQEGATSELGQVETEDDKAFYSLGYVVMKRASEFQLDEREKEAVRAGAQDALDGKEPSVEIADYQQRLAGIFRDRRARGSEAEKLASQEWVDMLAKEPGAVKTDSGLVFIESEPGSGERAQPTDTVRVHYHGTLRDGTVFDSSVQRGDPAVFPLNRVIPCWTEALQRMRPGGKARVVCPSTIAYGDRGAPPHIQPGAALHFDVELIEIVEP